MAGLGCEALHAVDGSGWEFGEAGRALDVVTEKVKGARKALLVGGWRVGIEVWEIGENGGRGWGGSIWRLADLRRRI